MLTQLYIKNFKALREADIPLGGVSLFTGPNAVGKSSALQPLLLLRQSIREGNFDKGLFLRHEDYLSLGLGKDVFSIGAAAAASLHFELEWDHAHSLKLDFQQELGRDVLPLLKLEPPQSGFAWAEEALFSRDFQYLSANRIHPQVQYPTSPYYVDELHALGKAGDYTVHYLGKYQDEPIAISTLQHPKAKSDTLLDNVSAWMADISAGIKVNATYHEELEIASLSYNFEIPSGYTEDFKPTNVGFGVTYVLPVITALLMLPRGGMLIVENPESHLHPAGQSKVARLCALAASAGVQVLMESHSDHVLNGLRVALKQGVIPPEDIKVYYFHRGEGAPAHETQMIPIFLDENGRADQWPEGFFDEWDKQLDKLLE
ncbi:MAG: DUF3696 domain-containing protein [Bacteroidetes bacterium]|nr:MAG: DUF3696 domain-containing protein [Bacteroidota bacterium]